MKSIRSIENELHAAGFSRADAKARAAMLVSLTESPQPMTTKLERAIERLAPNFRAYSQSLDQLPIHRLRALRAAFADGPDPADAANFDSDFQLAKAGIAEVESIISKRQAQQAEAVRTAKPVEGQERFHMSNNSVGGAPMLRDVNSGRIIRAYNANEPIASDGYAPDFGVGDIVRAAVTGNWNRLPSNVRAGSAGVGSAGGFLVPSELSAHVVDLARAKARVLQAGAITVPMPAGNLTVATVTGDPTPSWKAENSPFASSQGTYGAIQLVTKTLGVIVPLSLELIMSATNINEVVQTQLVQRLGLTLDSAAIYGDGTVNTPRGILSWMPTTNAFSAGGALTSATAYSWWNQAIGAVLGANAELNDLSILHNSDVETSLDGLLDTLYQPLRPTPNYASIKNNGRVYIANGIPTSGTPSSSYSIVGDFKQVLFGMQQSLSLEISREGGYVDTTGTAQNAFSNGQVLIRAMIMCDVAVLRPTFFSQVSDIQV